MSRRFLLLAALVVVAPDLAIAAPSKAWTAAKKVHVDAPYIAGIDVASAKQSELFKKFFPVLLKKEPAVGSTLDLLKQQCDFDPFAAINSIAVVMDDRNGGDAKGTFYLAMNGWDSAKVAACAQKLAKSINKELTIGTLSKGVQEFQVTGESDKYFLGWIGKDVIVISKAGMNDRAVLEKSLRSKGGGAAAKLVGKIDTGATLWFAAIKEQAIKEANMTMKSLHGMVKIAKGNVAADVRMTVDDKQHAADAVTQFQKELPGLAKQLPSAAQNIVNNAKLKSVGAEIQVTTTAVETDVVDLLNLVMAFM